MLKTIKQSALAGLAVLAVSLFGFSPLVSAATTSEKYSAVDSALAYIQSQQASDGSIMTWDDSGEWAALAFAAAGDDIDQVNFGGTSLLQYFINTKNIDSSSYKYAYTIEQRILALQAAGFDTTNFEGVDYNQILTGLYADNSIASSSSTYDDYFGLIVAYVTGDAQLLGYAQAAADQIAGMQQIDNGFCASLTCDWGTDTDSTSFAYTGLVLAKNAGIELSSGSIQTTIDNTYSYIMATETADSLFGAWGPSYTSTAIAAAALNLAGVDTAPIIDALIGGQESNGSFGEAYGVDTYTPAFAVLAILGTSWTLSPAPITRPAVEVPVTEPVVPVVEGDYQTTNYTKTIVSAAPAMPTSPAPIVEAPQAEATGEVLADTAPTDDNSTLKYVGYSLIFIAVLGIVVYVVLGSGSKTKA